MPSPLGNGPQPAYDERYLRRLRQRMRRALAEYERANADWLDLDAEIRTRYEQISEQVVAKQNSLDMQSAMFTLEFFREEATMYATILLAEYGGTGGRTMRTGNEINFPPGHQSAPH